MKFGKQEASEIVPPHTYMFFYTIKVGNQGLQPILFGLFLSMYLVTVLGNLFIILAVSSDAHLHTWMYLFLCNLSLTDICFISTTDRNMIVNIHTHSKEIIYVGCLMQMSFLIRKRYWEEAPFHLHPPPQPPTLPISLVFFLEK
ncbi:olfactory receptor [Cricetulus griseus]|nr:olfactory receptor [Cricetulus griseus]